MPLGAQYLQVVLSRWKLVAGLVVGGTLAGFLFSTLVLAQRPTFESAARLNIVPTSEELGYASRFVRGSTFDGGAVLLQTYAEFAHTRPIVAPIVDRYIADQARAAGQSEAAWIAANSVPSFFSPGRIVSQLNYGAAPRVPLRQDLIDNVIKNTLIDSVEGTYLLRIAVTWDDPQSAAWFANALADAITERAERMSARSGTQIAGSLENRLVTKRAELADLLRRSREMKASIGVVDIDRQKTALLEAQMAEQSRLTSDRAELQSANAQVAGLRRQTGGKLSAAQATVEQTLALEGPKASGLKDGIAIREGRIAQLSAQLAMVGRNEIAIKTLDDQAAALQTEVAALTERVGFSQTENLANAPRIQMVERASPALVRSTPKTLFNTVLGFIAGCALAGCALLLLGPAPARLREADEPVAEPLSETSPEPLPEGRPIKAAPRIDPGPVARAPAEPQLAEPQSGDPQPAEPEPAEPGPRRWQAAGKDILRRGITAAGNLAVKVAPDFSDNTPRPAPLRLVPKAPAPVASVAPVAGDGLLFPNVLPRPADGVGYRADEVASHGSRIERWLAAALSPVGRPLLIVAADGDADARCLYQLLHEYLKQQGVRVRHVDGVRAPLAGIARDDRKPLIYGGGFGGKGRLAVLREIEDDVAIVLVVRATPDGDAVAALDASSRGIAGLARKQPYALAIGN